MANTAAIAKERLLWCVDDRHFQEWKVGFDREWKYRDMRAAELMTGYWRKRGVTTAKPVVRVGASIVPTAGLRTVYRWEWKRI